MGRTISWVRKYKVYFNLLCERSGGSRQSSIYFSESLLTMIAINIAITKGLKKTDLEVIEYISLPTPSTISSGHSGFNSVYQKTIFLS